MSDTEGNRIHATGGLTINERLERIEAGMKEHEILDNSRHAAVMNEITEFKVDRGKAIGAAQMGNLIAVVVGLIATICSVAVAIWK